MVAYEIRRSTEHSTAAWAGGETTELWIDPPHSRYADRAFDFRISSASVTLEQSEFTALPGFKRHIMLLDGEMRLEHEGHHHAQLERFGQDFFDGAWNTRSFGKCVDLNLMLKDGLIGSLRCVRLGEPVICTDSFAAFYALGARVRIGVAQNNELVLTCVLEPHDLLTVRCTEPDKRYCITADAAKGLRCGEVSGILASVTR